MKLLCIGNSITLHFPAPAIGWHGSWGMAASAPENDYAHRLTAMLRAAGKTVDLRLETIVATEREPERFDETAFAPFLSYAPDVVVLRVGENVPDEKAEAFGAAYEKLLGLFCRQTRAAVYAVGSFWKKDGVEDAMRRAAERAGVTYVSLAPIQGEAYQAVGLFEHPGVAAHPSDKGMEAIAGIIFDAMRADGLLNGATVLPLPADEPAYKDISVTVDGKPVGCYAARVSAIPFNRVWPGKQRPLEQTETAPFLPFTLRGPADFCVATGETPVEAVIRPLSKNVVPVIDGGAVRFTLREPGQYTVEINGRRHALHLFAEADRPAAFDPAKATYRFPAGVHKLEKRLVRSRRGGLRRNRKRRRGEHRCLRRRDFRRFPRSAQRRGGLRYAPRRADPLHPLPKRGHGRRDFAGPRHVDGHVHQLRKRQLPSRQTDRAVAL